MVGSNKMNYKKLSKKVCLKISFKGVWQAVPEARTIDTKCCPLLVFFVLCLGTTKRSVPEDLSDLEGAYIKSISD